MLQTYFSKFTKRQKFFLGLGAWLIVWAAATMLFDLRNQAAFQIPNFYAEDGTIIYNNILTKNPLTAITTLFNGYLVVGQYLIGYSAVIFNHVLGAGGLASLAKWTAFSSCLFLGFTVSLPYLLLRRQLGLSMSLLVVLLGSLVPMLNSDYAIIGTIGNLKFAFLYIAFILLIYRNYRHRLDWRTVACDAAFLLCVLTDATVIFLLPFAFWNYRQPLYRLITTRFKNYRSIFNNRALLSLLTLSIIAVAYVLIVYVHGIPQLPGYLDTPYQQPATIPFIERSTVFSWLYPISTMFTNTLTIMLVVLVYGAWLLYRKQDYWLLALSVWSLFVGTALFVINRTGISALFLDYSNKGGPDQFFYAQNLIFIFTSVWLARNWFYARTRTGQLLIGLGIATYLVWAIPYGTSFGASKVGYQGMGTIKTDLSKACTQYAKQEKVIIQIYPTPTWQWVLPYKKAC